MAQGLTINDFKVTSDAFMRRLCSMFLADNWLWMVLPVAICAMCAMFIDVRFVIVAMMVLFIVLPMVLALLYFHYGLAPEARWSIMEKSATIDEQGITLTFADERMKKHVIPWNDVRDVIETKDALLLMLKVRRYTFLMLPASVVNPDVAQLFRKFIAQSH